MDSSYTSHSSPFTSLTDDILFKILSLLTESSDHNSFRSLSKTFYRVESLHRTHLRILRPEFLSPLLSKFPNVSSLDLSVCPRINDSTVTALLLSSSAVALRLRRLNLSRCSGLRHSGLDVLMRVCIGLESVDVSYCCGFGDREAAALSCAAGLRELCLDKCLNVSDVGLAKIAVGCSKLEKLSIKWCFHVTDLGIELLSKKCHQLKHLDLSYLQVTNASMCSVSRMERLEVLQIVGCRTVNDMGMHYIGQGCPSLQVLDVSRCDELSSSGFISVMKGHRNLLQLHASYCFLEMSTTFICQLENLKKLTILRIDGAQVSDTILGLIGRSCRFLTEIGLAKCRVTDMGMIELVAGRVNLKVLNLTCCKDITDLSILAIAETCLHLLCLKLECCNLLSEMSLYYLGSHSLLLEEIDLTDCPGINDTGLKYLSKCSHLLSLKLGLCTKITDKGLFYIASNCTKLRELDLYRCNGIGNDGIAAISRGCKKMKELILSYCTWITDRGISSLGFLEELSVLELRGLPNVTGIGLRTLAAGCKGLAELDVKLCENLDDSGFLDLAYYSRNLRQINLSDTEISDVGLCMVMGNLTCMQDAKLVNLEYVSVNGFEVALRACSARLKKLKLSAHLKTYISLEIVEALEARGCKIRWD